MPIGVKKTYDGGGMDTDASIRSEAVNPIAAQADRLNALTTKPDLEFNRSKGGQALLEVIKAASSPLTVYLEKNGSLEPYQLAAEGSSLKITGDEGRDSLLLGGHTIYFPETTIRELPAQTREALGLPNILPREEER
jgi:hypothetical protein